MVSLLFFYRMKISLHWYIWFFQWIGIGCTIAALVISYACSRCIPAILTLGIIGLVTNIIFFCLYICLPLAIFKVIQFDIGGLTPAIDKRRNRDRNRDRDHFRNHHHDGRPGTHYINGRPEDHHNNGRPDGENGIAAELAYGYIVYITFLANVELNLVPFGLISYYLTTFKRLMTACKPARYTGRQEEIEFYCELYKFYTVDHYRVITPIFLKK